MLFYDHDVHADENDDKDDRLVNVSFEDQSEKKLCGNLLKVHVWVIKVLSQI